jgi:hypothetical protein
MIWPFPFGMAAFAFAFIAFIIWATDRPYTPAQTTVTITQGEAPPNAVAKPDTSSTSDWTASHRWCDKEVPIVLTTQDRLEFDRAVWVIKYLDCSVSSRLPR